jgi:hypothetical protein
LIQAGAGKRGMVGRIRRGGGRMSYIAVRALGGRPPPLVGVHCARVVLLFWEPRRARTTIGGRGVQEVAGVGRWQRSNARGRRVLSGEQEVEPGGAAGEVTIEGGRGGGGAVRAAVEGDD